ncbi:unnamed protein product [Coffea canephora]|uniref:Uncharacterized protein n=1 Tax=Coffea canephora TaxID=49390 RepID=A0A068UAE3_COFCA|nr:unnamed protein product [Coffea canephora]
MLAVVLSCKTIESIVYKVSLDTIHFIILSVPPIGNQCFVHLGLSWTQQYQLSQLSPSQIQIIWLNQLPLLISLSKKNCMQLPMIPPRRYIKYSLMLKQKFFELFWQIHSQSKMCNLLQSYLLFCSQRQQLMNRCNSPLLHPLLCLE